MFIWISYLCDFYFGIRFSLYYYFSLLNHFSMLININNYFI